MWLRLIKRWWDTNFSESQTHLYCIASVNLTSTPLLYATFTSWISLFALSLNVGTGHTLCEVHNHPIWTLFLKYWAGLISVDKNRWKHRSWVSPITVDSWIIAVICPLFSLWGAAVPCQPEQAMQVELFHINKTSNLFLLTTGSKTDLKCRHLNPQY